MTMVPPRLLKQKANVVRDVDGRRAWAFTQKKCAACWLSSWNAWHWLETHHIVSSAGRCDSLPNLLRACNHCHRAAEGERIMVHGTVLPTLSIGACLTLKMESDPGNFDLARLEILYGQRLPRPEAVPEWFLKERGR